ncbi:MAG: helix-turn-helix domain-containing protein, partial [Thermodesulfobacteriota bacterium]|nr:helix-turn-helix domain-containing protein [Thermodesulfobacteriota bacterium]
VKIAAYCLLSNHYHLLIQTPDSNLSRSMRHLNGVYTKRYNRRHGYDGQLFRGRYKSIVVESDSYALELVRYIHRNPLEAGLVDNLQKYPWSSHKPYLSNAKKWKWLYKDYILKLFEKSKPESIRLYGHFVIKEIPEQINQIFGRRNLPAVLGSKRFIDRIKWEFFNVENFEEIPETKRLSPDIEKIKSAVCRAYRIKESELYVSRRWYSNEPRNVVVYLARYLRNDTLKAVGEKFGIEKYSTVSSIVEKVKSEKESEKGFKKRVQILAEQIINSQWQTCPLFTGI